MNKCTIEEKNGGENARKITLYRYTYLTHCIMYGVPQNKDAWYYLFSRFFCVMVGGELKLVLNLSVYLYITILGVYVTDYFVFVSYCSYNGYRHLYSTFYLISWHILPSEIISFNYWLCDGGYKTINPLLILRVIYSYLYMNNLSMYYTIV